MAACIRALSDCKLYIISIVFCLWSVVIYCVFILAQAFLTHYLDDNGRVAMGCILGAIFFFCFRYKRESLSRRSSRHSVMAFLAVCISICILYIILYISKRRYTIDVTMPFYALLSNIRTYTLTYFIDHKYVYINISLQPTPRAN